MAERVVAALLVVGMVDPSVEGILCLDESRSGVLEQSSIEGEVVVADIVAYTARDGSADGVVDFEIGDTAIGVHEFECNGNIADSLTTIVDHAEGDGVFLEIDTARGTRRTHFGDRDIVVERRIDTHVDGSIVAGAVAGAEAGEVVGRVVEILRCFAPVSGTVVVVVAVVEEVATGGVAMPTDGAVGVLGGIEIAIGAIVDHGVVGDGHFGSVVGSDVDIAGGIVMILNIEFMMYETTQTDGDISDVAGGIEVGLVGNGEQNIAVGTDWQVVARAEGVDIGIVASGEVGEALSGRLVTIVVVAESEGEIAREVFLTGILEGVAERHLVHAAVFLVHSAVDGHRDQLEVVGRIDEELGCVEIVDHVAVGRSGRQIAFDNHIVGVEDAKRRGYLNAVLNQTANRHVADGAYLGRDGR